MVTWQDVSAGVGGATGDSSSSAVKAQVFAADGTRVGSELLVNTATASGQDSPQITALSNGGFVVTWEDYSLGVGGATGDSSEHSREGAGVRCRTGRASARSSWSTPRRRAIRCSPQITALSNGGFVVTWQDHSHGVGGATGDSSGTAVKAQVFAADGTPRRLGDPGQHRDGGRPGRCRRSRRCRMAASW